MKSKKRSSGDKTAKKDFPKQKYYIVLGIAIIIVALLLILLVRVLFDNLEPNYYSVEARNDSVEQRNEAAQDKNASYDVVGWVKVQGTNIDFPVVSGKDESFTSPVESTGYGWLSILGDPSYHNVLNIYGHNVMNLGKNPLTTDESFQRFEELVGFANYDFANKNLYFQYSMNGEDHLYKIFAVSVLDSANLDGLPEEDYSEEEIDNYIKMLKDSSLYDYDVKVDSNDDIVSLITCTGLLSGDDSYNDIVVSGRKVGPGEDARRYSVTKTEKYKLIKNDVKGDVE